MTTVPQNMQALACANETRAIISQFRREVASKTAATGALQLEQWAGRRHR